MPGMDGFETTAKIVRLLNQHGYKGCTILALTSYTTNDTDKKAERVGMQGVYRKPM